MASPSRPRSHEWRHRAPPEANRKMTAAEMGPRIGTKLRMNATSPPKNRIADPGRPHDQGGRSADNRVHEGNCEEIGGNIAFDLLRDVDRLPLASKPGQNLDEPSQETVPRHKQEVEKHHGRKQAAGEASRPGKDARENRSAVQRPSRASLN